MKQIVMMGQLVVVEIWRGRREREMEAREEEAREVEKLSVGIEVSLWKIDIVLVDSPVSCVACLLVLYKVVINLERSTFDALYSPKGLPS